MLQAEIRQSKRGLGAYRREGKIPAVVYGHGIQSVSVLMDKQEFLKHLKAEGKGSLLDLKIASDEPVKVILQDLQKHTLTQEYLHLDFYRIRMDEKMRVKVLLIFTGEAPAVKTGGVLVKAKDHVEIECLPKDLISSIAVDLSSLSELRASIKVRDLSVGSGISIIGNPDDIIVTIAEIKEDIEDAALAAQKEKEQLEKLKAEPEEKKDAEEGKEKDKAKDKAKEKK